MPEHFIEAGIFILGICIGSFLNVCIFRIPASRSIVHPGSTCPNCGNRIRFYDNIPIVSYMVLRGKCRRCGRHISLRYPLIELLSGIVALSVYFRFGPTLEGVVYFTIIAALITISFIDLDHGIIPDVISLPGIIVCFLTVFALPTISWKESIIGILAGAGSLHLVALIYSAVRKKDGMGGGDIKLLAGIGAFLGWKIAILIFFIAPVFGAIVGVIVKIRKKVSIIPYGPFISLSTFIALFWGKEIIEWIFRY